MARPGFDWLTGLLAVGCLSAVALIYADLGQPPFEPATSLPVEQPVPQRAAPLAWEMPPSEAFSPVLARPLFTEGRRPPKQEAASAASDVRQEALSLAVTAVVLAPGRRLAIVETGPGTTETLSLNDEVDGWRLVEIGAEHLVFDGGAQRQRIALKDLPGAKADSPGQVAAVPREPASEPLATTVTIDGREIEVLPEHQGERGEGSLLAAVPANESESNNR